MPERYTFDKTSNLSSLTLTDIAPKWANRFKQLPVSILSLKGLQWALELTAADRCLVGEAHGFSASYLQTCNVCEVIGSNFQTNFIIRSYENLKKNTEKLDKQSIILQYDCVVCADSSIYTSDIMLMRF